ncbi:nuclear transport factor 2 family protein [Roseobacteraceae bacterium S113]
MISFAKIAAAALYVSGVVATSAAANPELWGDDQLKQTAVELLTRGTLQGDIEFIREHVAEDYIQHNPHVPDGRDAVIGFVQHVQASGAEITGQAMRVIRDGDLVLVHSLANLGQGDLAVFDLFRFEDGIAVEHWDVIQPHPEETVSGRSMVDGASEVTDLDLTEANRALVMEFMTTVFVNGALERAPDFIGDPYIQHSPHAADGLDAFMEVVGTMAEQGFDVSYDRIHRSVAEGNFVLTQSEGAVNGTPTAFYDLFRVEDGRLVEHWDVVQSIPDEMPHDNGMF